MLTTYYKKVTIIYDIVLCHIMCKIDNDLLLTHY